MLLFLLIAVNCLPMTGINQVSEEASKISNAVLPFLEDIRALRHKLPLSHQKYSSIKGVELELMESSNLANLGNQIDRQLLPGTKNSIGTASVLKKDGITVLKTLHPAQVDPASSKLNAHMIDAKSNTGTEFKIAEPQANPTFAEKNLDEPHSFGTFTIDEESKQLPITRYDTYFGWIRDKVRRFLKLKEYHPLYIKRNDPAPARKVVYSAPAAPAAPDLVKEHSFAELTAAASGMAFLGSVGYSLSEVKAENERLKKQ